MSPSGLGLKTHVRKKQQNKKQAFCPEALTPPKRKRDISLCATVNNQFNHKELHSFFVFSCSEKLILLGLLWLARHEPRVSWSIGKIYTQTP